MMDAEFVTVEPFGWEFCEQSKFIGDKCFKCLLNIFNSQLNGQAGTISFKILYKNCVPYPTPVNFVQKIINKVLGNREEILRVVYNSKDKTKIRFKDIDMLYIMKHCIYIEDAYNKIVKPTLLDLI